MIRRPPRSTQSRSSAASDVYKRQDLTKKQGSQPNLQPDPNRKLGSGGLNNMVDNQIDKGVDTMFANQQFQNQMKSGANQATQQAVNNALGDKTGNSAFGKLAGNLAEKVVANEKVQNAAKDQVCLLYTSPSPRDVEESRMPSSA
eukprot:TRINITY_DN1051_c0_g1_i1.p3 TRINITY_DN1051_c0_g1~~TRINITY_DN1051_c0_g1_i1.p3  ORF type:complete len:145 (-),score=99.99 TRINITY_DN1051_c0_g1_i1:17-451(-)